MFAVAAETSRCWADLPLHSEVAVRSSWADTTEEEQQQVLDLPGRAVVVQVRDVDCAPVEGLASLPCADAADLVARTEVPAGRLRPSKVVSDVDHVLAVVCATVGGFAGPPDAESAAGRSGQPPDLVS